MTPKTPIDSSWLTRCALQEYLALGGAFTHLRGGLALLNHIGVPLKLARENVQAGNAIQNLIV